MPNTPNFAIPYPCADDVIDPTVIADWADGIDAAIQSVEFYAQLASHKYRASATTALTGTAVAVGVATAMSFTTTLFNNGLTVAATGIDSPGLATDGYYLLSAEFSPLNAATTSTSWKAWIVANGVIVAQRSNGDSVPGTSSTRMNVSNLGLLVAAGTEAQAFFQWTGTGGPVNVYCRFSAALIAPFP